MNDRVSTFLESITPELRQTLGVGMVAAAWEILKMMLPTVPDRPALPAVLDALVDWHPGEERPSQWLAMDGVRVLTGLVSAPGGLVQGVHFVVPPVPRSTIGRDVRRAWITGNPNEAYEILQARGIVPMTCGFFFVCRECDGTGIRDRLVDAECLDCVGGMTLHPASMADLVAWASLGAAVIATAEDLAREREISPGNPVAWAVRSWQPSRAYLEWEHAEKALLAMGLPVDYSNGDISVLSVPMVGS